MTKKQIVITTVSGLALLVIVLLIVKSGKKNKPKNLQQTSSTKSDEQIELENLIKVLVKSNDLSNNQQLYRFSMDSEDFDRLFPKMNFQDIKSLHYVLNSYVENGEKISNEADINFLKKLADSLQLNMQLS